jgi:hypothetical protein
LYGGRGYFYGGRYWGPSIYFGVGGWGYPYLGYPYWGYPYYWDYPYYSGYPYYGYDPYYYSYDPYRYPYPPQGQGRPAPPQQPQTQPQSTTGNNQGQNFYLIAFNDQTIQAATAYKVEGDQIHWITREGKEMQAPLSSVDVPFSRQINRDRHVDFQIP